MGEEKGCLTDNTCTTDVHGKSPNQSENGNCPKQENCHNNNADVTVENKSASLKNNFPSNTDSSTALLGMRHVQVLLLFCCFFVSFYMRTNISLAIVAMTNKNSSHSDHTVYSWTEPEKGTVLSSFYWGYLLMLPFAGQLGLRYPSKLLLGLSLFEGSVLSLVTPFVTSIGGWQALCGLRALQGLNQVCILPLTTRKPPIDSCFRSLKKRKRALLFEHPMYHLPLVPSGLFNQGHIYKFAAPGISKGFLTPITYTLASKWSPPNERNRFVGFSLNGAIFGVCLAMPMTGYLAESRFGWPSIFYSAGLFGILWTILWYLYGADSPACHPKISEKEKNLIIDSLGTDVNDSKILETPWKEIFTSLPVWALICAHLGNGWAFGILSTQLPSFINSALGFNIGANGLLSALPFFSMWILTFPTCWMGDELISRGILSKTASRKLWTAVALAGGPLIFILMTCIGDNIVIIMTLMVIATTCFMFIFIGFNINHLDLTPNFAGLLMGICNGFEMITTLIAPLIVGFIVYAPSSIDLWRRMFMITASVGVTSSIVYAVFGSGKIQPWNEFSQRKNSIPFLTKSTKVPS